ncbi:MAG: hypothetical protein PHW60_15565, partial [Kiritimatiellae bacterium]|nr:hypothetical protein [Kiritimatiellia bacterium]
AGTIKDLSSDARLNLIIRMQTEMALGLGKFIQSQDPAALDAAPAQELYRLEARNAQRNWPSIWQTAGGQFYGGGRMIALKNDPVWTEISDFGQPYPPFKYGSGMWTRDILRPEAEALGVLDPGAPAPDPAEITALPKVSSVSDLSEDLRAALLDSMPGAEFINGVLRLP